MRKLWLTFTAMLLCSIASFAQTRDTEGRIIINSPEEFLKIGTTTGYTLIESYIQTVDIDLGTFENSKAIIPHNQTSSNQQNYIFQGTYDGGGKTITYQASFAGTQGSGNYALFNQVSGTIKNLNIDANVTLSGNANDMNVALICGYLRDGGIIEYCNALGNVNSTVNPSGGGGSDAGLLVGESAGIVRYCKGSGNVVGVGFVGGLIGQMKGSASVLACSFTGSVTANYPDSRLSANYEQYGNFAGGICGHASNNTIFSFCTVDGNVNRSNTNDGDAEGIICSAASGNASGGRADVANCYGTGTVDGSPIDADDDLADNNGTIGALYYEGEDNMSAQDIVNALEAARISAGHNEFYFDVVNGQVILIIGQRACKTPSNLRVTPSYTYADLAWDAPAGATRFEVTITGGHLITQEGGRVEIVNGTTYRATGVGVSETPYQVTVRTLCGDNFYSDGISTAFNSTCPNINGLTVNNITHETATATWTSTASTTFEVRLYEGNNINSNPIYTTSITESQTQASINLSSLNAATQYTIEVVASCGTNVDVEANHSILTFITKPVNFETAQSGNFNDANTWQGNVVPDGNVANITINTGHIVTVNHNLKITNDYKIDVNNGVLQITQQGQLINTSDVNVPGIVEIVSPQKSMNSWTFIGAPFGDTYKLGTIYPMSHDISVSKYNYSTANWSDSWAHTGTSMDAGEGYFAWPFYDGAIIFTTYGDVWNYETSTVGNYDFTRGCHTALNNDDVTVTETIAQSNNGGHWMALSNPYPAKLHVNAFKGANNLQGNCVYVFREGSFDINATDINMTEGFFVNFGSEGQKSVTFTKEQLSYNYQPSTGAKASANEFIKLTLINGNKKVRAYLAHNENAEQGYDIFDANKLFAPTEIAEPYFVTDGIALMKEEFAELPYYATMNVRSFANDTVSFVVNNIPEGLAVSIIDGEEVIDMIEGGVYTTEILTGENADRFKVLIKKNLGIADVEELEVNITNNNRHISIATTETDLQVEVYNALGQKVLSTKDRNFTLNQVSAGAYLIKAFNNKASKTQKIVVE